MQTTMKLKMKTAFYVAVTIQAIILLYLLTFNGRNAILDFSRAPLAWFFNNNEETSIILNTTHVCNPLKPKITHKPGELFLIVLVMSKSLSEDTREAVRQTWAAANSTNAVSYVVFVLGCTPSVHLDRDVDKEATKYHDLLRVESQENKEHYELKRLWLAYRWTAKYQPKFIITTHYHVYVRLPHVIHWLKDASSLDKLYAGKVHSNVVVNRDPKKQYFVSNTTYLSTKFPDYCSGAFYVFSGNVLNLMLALEKQIPKFDVEDAYVGVLMKQLEVKPTDIDNKVHIESNLGNDVQSWTNKLYSDVFVIGMDLSPGLIQYIHDRYRKIEQSRYDEKT